MLYLGTIFQVAVLFINAVAILNEERFLARIGLSSSSLVQQQQQGYTQNYDQPGYASGGSGPPDIGVKGRLITLISAVRTLLRIPLIFLNISIIGYELILGG